MITQKTVTERTIIAAGSSQKQISQITVNPAPMPNECFSDLKDDSEIELEVIHSEVTTPIEKQIDFLPQY